jgi:hypothetical protein
MIRFSHPTLLACILAVAMAGAAVAAPAQPSHDATEQAAQRAAYDQAVELFRAGRHAAAYGRLMPLADAGHVPSAHLSLLMVNHGKALFGTEWSATEAQQARWRDCVINGLRGFAQGVTNEAGD